MDRRGTNDAHNGVVRGRKRKPRFLSISNMEVGTLDLVTKVRLKMAEGIW